MMQSSLYGTCVLVSIFTLHLTTAVKLTDQLTLKLGQHKFIEHSEPEDPISNSLISDKNEQDRTKSDISLQDGLIRPTRSTKSDKKRKMLLKAIRQILENKTRTQNDLQLDKMTQKDLDTVAVSDLVRLVLSTNHRFKRYAKPVNKINKRIDEVKHGRDIVLEAVKLLIEDEKTRRHFDMVNPPNSQYSKLQQLLWDRIRIKAAEELLLHPISLPERVTERIYDSLKLDLQMQTTEATSEAALFGEFKRKIQKEKNYLDEYGVKEKEFNTIKPRVFYPIRMWRHQLPV